MRMQTCLVTLILFCVVPLAFGQVKFISSRVAGYDPPYDYSGYSAQALIRKLSSEYEDERLSAVHFLAYIENTEDRQDALSPLVSLFLHDVSKTIQRFSWSTLNHYDFNPLDLVPSREAHQETLLIRLKDPGEATDLRGMAAFFLGRLKSHAAVPELIHRLDDPDFDIRRRSADALGYLADTRSLTPIKAHLSAATPGSRDYLYLDAAYQELAKKLGRKLRGAAAVNSLHK